MNIVDHKFCSVMNEEEKNLMVKEEYPSEKDFVFVAKREGEELIHGIIEKPNVRD